HIVRLRRFPYIGQARAGLAAGAAARRRSARRQRAAHRDAGAGAAAGTRLRRPSLPSRLLSILAVYAAGDTVSHNAARAARPAGAPTGVQDVRGGAADLDLQCPAQAGSTRRLGPHYSPWLAGTVAGSAAGLPVIFRVPRPHLAREGGRRRDPDRAAV